MYTSPIGARRFCFVRRIIRQHPSKFGRKPLHYMQWLVDLQSHNKCQLVAELGSFGRISVLVKKIPTCNNINEYKKEE